MADQKVDELLEALNRAIEIHTDKAIEKLPYNKTELCEIIDNGERGSGKYTVWNGSAKYYAYSENTTYEVGMKVYVNIPNDDFTSQKTIIGQSISNGEKAVFYKNPLDSYEPLTPNLIKDIGEIKNYTNDTAELIANHNLENATFDNDPEAQVLPIYEVGLEGNNTYQGFKYMGISAEFKTLLKAFSPIAGDYGLEIVVWGTQRNDVTTDATIVKRYYTLSTQDFIGNVYDFGTYYQQSVLYDISDFESIARITVGFYQRGDFKQENGDNIPTYFELGGIKQAVAKNLFVHNISIQFGNDLVDATNSARIYTINGLTYDPAQNKSANSKNIELQWTHFNSNTQKSEVLRDSSDFNKTDLAKLNYTIHWYRQALHKANEYLQTHQDKLATAKKQMQAYDDWKAAEKNGTDEEKQEARVKMVSTYNLRKGVDYIVNETTGLIDSIPGATENKINSEYKTAVKNEAEEASLAADDLAGYGWVPLDGAGTISFAYSNFYPDFTRQYDKVKCIIEYGHKLESGGYDSTDPDYRIIKSNELEFTNLRAISNQESDDKAKALKISFEDGTNGQYTMYNGSDGKILNDNDWKKDRILSISCNSLATGESYLNGNEILIWGIPVQNTMFSITESDFALNDGVDATKSDFEMLGINPLPGYRYIRRKAIDTPNIPVYNKQRYRIKQYYNRAYSNNTIYAYLIKNNNIFTASVSAIFGQHGTSGTDYTFTLGFLRKVDKDWNEVGPADSALTIGDQNYLEIGFELFNSKDEKIDLTNEQKLAIINAWRNPKKDNSDGYWSGADATINGYLEWLSPKPREYRIAVRAANKPIADFRYIVLQASVTGTVTDDKLGDIKFTQLLPIHVRAKDSTWTLEGSDYVTYDDKGTNPSFYNDAYRLIDANNNHIDSGFNLVSSEVINNSYFPQFINIENNRQKLQVPPLYLTGNTRNVAIINGDKYTCPLVIIQNKYGIPAINKWNGSLTVDADNNRVLAAMVGAGHKEPDNTFSGVVMGDVIQKDHRTNKETQSTGLFGYEKGQQTYAFDTNGSAYIGAAGVGRIYVDGRTGQITSAAREDYEIAKAQGLDAGKVRGVDFNLAKNYLDIQSTTSNAGIHIDTSANNDEGAYFSVRNDQGQKLMQVGDSNYYLQSGDGRLKLDLKNGSFTSDRQFTLKAGPSSSLYFGDDNNYVTMNNLNGGSTFEMNRRGQGVIDNTSSAWQTLLNAYSGSGVTPTRDSGYQLTNEIALRDKISSYDSQISTLRQQIDNLQSDKTFFDNLNTAQRNYDNARMRYQSANETLTKAQQDYTNADPETAKKNVDSAKITLDNAKKETSEKQQAYNEVSQKVPIAQAILFSAQTAIANTQSKYDDALKTYNDSVAARDKTQSDLETAQNELAIIQADENATEEEITAAQNKVDNAQNALNKAQSSVEASQTALESAQNDLDKMKEQYDINALEQAVADAQAEQKKAEDEYNSAQTAEQQASVDYDNAVYTYNNAEAVRSSAQAIIDEYTPKVATYKTEMDNAATALQEAQDAYNSQDNTTKAKQAQLSQFITTRDNMESALDSYINAQAGYKAAVEGGGEGYISISNVKNKRIDVNGKFYVTADGSIHAENGYFQGQIQSTSGNIGGWAINSNSISQNNAGMQSSSDPNSIAFWAGSNNQFYVTHSGYLKATNANITGTIYATAGNIGNATIANGVLRVPQADVEGLNAQIARIDRLEATSVTTSYLAANYATISSLNAATARIGRLETNYANIQRLVAQKATINDVTSYLAHADFVQVKVLYGNNIHAYNLVEGKIVNQAGTNLLNDINGLRKRIEALEKKRK